MMVEAAKSWVKENATLVYFLLGQLLAICTAGLTFTAYMVKLESRVNTLEVRGSPHLADINNRLTSTEKETENNKARLSMGNSRKWSPVLYPVVLAWLARLRLHRPSMSNKAILIAMLIGIAVFVGVQFSGVWNCC